MADNQYDETDDNSTGENPNWRRDLERRASEGDKAKKELESYKRRDAARSAGLDPDKPLVGMFLKGYDGELTADAIKDAAAEVGLIDATATPTGDQSDEKPPEHPAQGQMDAIGEAAGAPTPTGVDTAAELAKAYESGGVEGLLDQVEKYGVPVTTRQ